jgi:hypothetical protein
MKQFVWKNMIKNIQLILLVCNINYLMSNQWMWSKIVCNCVISYTNKQHPKNGPPKLFQLVRENN